MDWIKLVKENKQKILKEFRRACTDADNNGHLYFKVYLWKDGDVTTLETHNQDDKYRATLDNKCIEIGVFNYPFGNIKINIDREVKEAWLNLRATLESYPDFYGESWD